LRDIDALVSERLEALQAEKKAEDEGETERRRSHAYSYFRRNLSENHNVIYLVYNEGTIAGYGDVSFVHRRPVLRNQGKERAYISNLYTRPEYRGKEGEAALRFKLLALLVNASIEDGASEITADVDEGTDAVFRKYGFTKNGNEWRLER
jgi:ribosomal protein S18 acetylase RimI-like enzyme